MQMGPLFHLALTQAVQGWFHLELKGSPDELTVNTT